MRSPRLFGLVAGLALLLVSCGQQSPPAPQKGTLDIALQGVSQASIQVVGSGKTIFEDTIAAAKSITLEPGTYTIDGQPLAGYEDPSPAALSLKAGETTKMVLVYQKQQATNPAVVAKLELLSVKDAVGAALPGADEHNDNKVVKLYASQTEEPVCVSVRATDAAGAPVAGAPIVVGTSEVFGDHIAIIRGCAQGQLGTMAFRDNLFTGEDGTVVFTLFATYGGSPADKLLLMDQPAKIVVAAENANNTAVLSEFKVFFYNISHLYYNKQATKARIGATFAETNLFKPLNNFIDRGDAEANEFAIAASLFTKQPQQAVKLPYPLFEFKYELLAGSDKVEFVRDTCDDGMNATVCTDYDGYVRIEPKAGLGLKDLPIQATVKVTLYVRYEYGNALYVWPLKDFTVTKKWIGTYLSISKSVDHHVLTWAAPNPSEYPNKAKEYTLEAANDPAIAANGVFTATMTVKVRNEGNEPAYKSPWPMPCPPSWAC